MMNNGNNGRVMVGRPQQPQQPGMQQPGMQQPQSNYNPFALLAGAAAKFAGGINTQNNSMASLYSYGPSRTNYAAMIGLDDNIGEEQIKKQALAEGGHVANHVVNLCMQRKQGSPMYLAWKSALDRFKSVERNGPKDHALEQFVNDVENNQALHNFILAQVGIQFGSFMAWQLMTGNDQIRSQQAMQDVVYHASIDILTLQFIDYLSNNSQEFYKMSALAKKAFGEREEPTFQQVMTRCLFADMECPYSKGKMGSIAENTIVHNPLLDVAEPANMGMGGHVYDMNTIQQQTNIGANDFSNWVAQRVNSNKQNNIYGEVVHQQNQMSIPSYDNFDKPTLKIEDFSFENRMQFNLSDFGAPLGQTGFWLLHRYHLDFITKAFRKQDGSSYSMRDTNVLGKLAVWSFDWQQGTFDYRFINYSLSDPMEMNDLISDPSKLLPLMYEEDGVQKTTWDPKVMETSEFIREGYIVPMEEMKELKEKPNVMVSSRPMQANISTENTISRIDIFTESHDPTSKLDAFVLPMANTRQWTLPVGTDMDLFYSQFKLMVRGNKEEKVDTARVIRSLRGQCREYGDEEFVTFLNDYLTNLVNRWLVESRGYAESKTDKSLEYLRVGNLFEDLEDLLEYLKQNDHPALRAFMDYGSNDFIRNGIEILMSKEDAQKEFEELLKKEDDETRAVMMTAAKRKIIFKRDSVFINMIKENGPVQLDAVYLKESINPELFAVVRKAIEVAGRHFSEYPQVLMKFRKDKGNKVWVLTRSGIDPEGVFVLRAVSSEEDLTHPFPVCK